MVTYGKPTERVPVLSFAREISTDLEELTHQHPNGIYLSDLQEFYGESIARIQKAVEVLEGQRVIVKRKSSNNAYYILPALKSVSDAASSSSDNPLNGLTELQSKLVMFLLKTCQDQNVKRLRTNYSQLTRVLGCSYGGLKQCIKRLVELEYLQIIEPSRRGKADDMVIALGPKLDS